MVLILAKPHDPRGLVEFLVLGLPVMLIRLSNCDVKMFGCQSAVTLEELWFHACCAAVE